MKRRHFDGHLAFVRTLPCVICLAPHTTEAAHVRYGDLRVAKQTSAFGKKPDDTWTLPLCGNHHRAQHELNERKFWEREKIDPIFICLALWEATGDFARGNQIVAMSHQRDA